MSARLHPWTARLALTALACCAWGSAAQAMTLVEATGSGYVSPDNGSTRLPLDVTRQTLNGAQSASGSREVWGVSADRAAGMAGLSGSSYAAPGVLKAKIDGRAWIAPQDANVPNITDPTPIADGTFSSRFVDSVRLTSSTLPDGALAEFTFTVNMHVETNRPGHTGPAAAGYDSGNFYFHYFFGDSVERMYRFPNGLYTSAPSFSFSLPVTVSGVVGDVLTFGAELSVSADDRAGWYQLGGYLWPYGIQQETHIDASNTARFYLDAITPGLTLVSESGHDYATSPVPEPGTWALLAGGLCLVGWHARRGVRPAENRP